MARSIFFSFHYNDVASFRVNVVRQSHVMMKENSMKFIDRSLWEEAKMKGEKSLKKLIDDSLVGSSVTVVLVGSETHSRRWVKYEIVKSFIEGKGIMVIHINRIRGKNHGITARGTNPLEKLSLELSEDYSKIHFYENKNRRKIPYKDLPQVNNRKANSIHFAEFTDRTFLIPWFNYQSRIKYRSGFYRLSEIFNQEYDWVLDDGFHNIGKWVEQSASRAKSQFQINN